MKRSKFNNSIFILISSIVIFGNFVFFSVNDKDFPDVSNNRGNSTVGMLVSGQSVEQTFIAEHDGLTSINILLATYNRVNNANITISLSDFNNVIYTNTFSATQLQDNAFYYLDFDTISDSKDKMYRIELSSDASDANNAITAWTSDSDNYKAGKLYINGQDAGCDIAFQSFYSSKENSGLFTVSVTFMLTSFVAIRLIFEKINLKRENMHITFIFLICNSVCLAVVSTFIYNYFILKNIDLNGVFCISGLLRTAIFFVPSIFISAFFYFSNSQIFDFLFYKRWAIGGTIFVIAVCLNLNFSNVSAWNEYIQPSIKPELSEPIIGFSHSIRGDEWLVDLTRKATGELVGFGDKNFIFRGTYNSGLAGSGLYLSYSALNNPFNWGFYLFGFERGLSFYWMGVFIFGFLISFELCYIISNNKRLYALFGAVIIVLSQFLLWWSVPLIWIAMQAIIVFANYFVHSNKRLKKLFFATGEALSCTCFVTSLYPAWQVPLTYVILAFFMWIIFENLEKIKSFKLFDWIIIFYAFILMLSIILKYFYDNKFYMENIMNTVYPGHRISTGGWILNKAFNYPLTLLFPFKSTTNPCEAGTMFNLFPIPFIIALLNVTYQCIQKALHKKFKIDLLSLFLLTISMFLFIYCSFGVNECIAKITLSSYSTPERAVDVLGLLCVFLMIRNLSVERKKIKVPIIISIIISLLTVMTSIYYSNLWINNYMPIVYISFISILIFGFSTALFDVFSEKRKNRTIKIAIIVIGICGLSVSPINSGVNALKHKPVAYEIQKIVKADPEAIWASTYWFASNYVAANGGRCITSTNYIPNLDLWRILDTQGLYDDIYNRYAHINFQFTEEATNFELIGMDSIALNLNLSDLSKCEVDYIYSQGMLLSNDLVNFELLYGEDGSYIYKVNYL